MTNFQDKKRIKALVMFSGGLDSSLAARILQEQGVEVAGIHFTGVFHAGKFDEYHSRVRRFTDKFGIKLTTFCIEDDFIDILRNPRYGYGGNINPCIDCRIYTLKKAKEHMERTGASFVATGEVLGQRPMSQRRNILELVEKRSGLDGLLLRPLSAKLLEPTIPEEKGWVERENLLDMKGRSRKPQMALAERYGIKDYSTPAGGCLLTDPQFSERVRDLIKHNSLAMDEIEFLKVGRHFRLSNDAKAIVGRNQDDNDHILKVVKKNDVIIKLKDIPGPLTALKGRPATKEIEMAGAITARYSKAREHNGVEVSYYEVGADDRGGSFSIKPAKDADIKKCMI